MSKQEALTKPAATTALAAPLLSPQMQEYLAEQEASVDHKLKFISTAGGIFTYEKQPIPNNSLAVLILDFVVANLFYKNKFNPSQPSPPDCFAFGRGKTVMTPHPDSSEKMGANCNVCKFSKFGSAKDVEWKNNPDACGCNMKRRLALLCIGEVRKDGKVVLDASTIDSSEICYLTVPVMSVKYFSEYKDTVVKLKKLPLFLTPTQIDIANDKKSMWKMTFKEIKTALNPEGQEHPVSLLDPVTMAKIEARVAEARAFIETPYSVFTESDEVDDVVDTHKEKF